MEPYRIFSNLNERTPVTVFIPPIRKDVPIQDVRLQIQVGMIDFKAGHVQPVKLILAGLLKRHFEALHLRTLFHNMFSPADALFISCQIFA